MNKKIQNNKKANVISNRNTSECATFHFDRLNLKKSHYIFFCIIIMIAVLFILFISISTKYIVEKFDEKYTDRQIEIGWAYTNPFTGYIYLNNLKIYEYKNLDTLTASKVGGQSGDSIFFSAKSVNANLAMLKLLSKKYEISKITLNQPWCMLIQNGKEFNFSDLIEKFSSKDTSMQRKEPVNFRILNTKIIDGEFYYHEKQIPINYSIKNVNFDLKRRNCKTDTITAKFSLLQGIGEGNIKGDLTLNLKNKDYRFAVVVHKFDLNIVEQYLNDLTNYGSFSSTIDADIKSSGNINSVDSVTTSGMIDIHDLHLGKNPNDDYLSFDRLVLALDEISPKNHKYFYDSVSISNLYFKYEKYDYLDNLQTMFGENGSNIKAAKARDAKFNLVIEIMNLLEEIGKNFFISHYKINRLAIYNADIKFNDFSISEIFSINLKPLNIIADSIDKNHDRVEVSFESGLKPFGNLSVNLSINPKDSTDFDIQYHFQKLPLSMFNPYIISYTSFPLDRGTIEFNGNWHVRNKNIQSVNHLSIINPHVAKRLVNKKIKWMPVPLILAFINEEGNFIDYEIPITGSLSDPNFHFSDVASDLLRNIFLNPTTESYIKEVKKVQIEIDKTLRLNWGMRFSSLTHDQLRFIKKMADYMGKNPSTSINVYPQQYALKEREYMLYFEAKKKYYIDIENKTAQSFSLEDSTLVDNMSIKDSLFVQYLNKHMNESLMFTIQEKCEKFIDKEIVDAKIKQLYKEREDVFVSYFKDKNADKQMKIFDGENVIPYNGLSFYKIEYKGKFPRSLSRLHKKMIE